VSCQAARTRLCFNTQYSLTKRYSVYLAMLDLNGYVQHLQVYAPDTPDYARSSRHQELGYYTTVCVRGAF